MESGLIPPDLISSLPRAIASIAEAGTILETYALALQEHNFLLPE